MDLDLKILRIEHKEFRSKSKIVARRILALIELNKRKNVTVSFRELDFTLVGEKFNVTGRTIRNWFRAYKQGGPKGLCKKRDRKLGRPRDGISGWTVQYILRYRTLYNWGAETIQAHLLLDHAIKISRWKIHQLLIRKKLISKTRKRKIKNRHTTVVVVETPGVHTQLDVKHLPHLLPKNEKCYVYNFVDHASRWEFKRAFDSYGPLNTRNFFEELLTRIPFSIACSQTDNGVEFTNKFVSNADNLAPHAFDLLLVEHNIRHRLIPPGEKELNGLVERSHRADDEELYHRIKPKNLQELNDLLDEHCKFRNSQRRRKPLNWQTPNQVLVQKGIDLKSTIRHLIDELIEDIDDIEFKKAA